MEKFSQFCSDRLDGSNADLNNDLNLESLFYNSVLLGIYELQPNLYPQIVLLLTTAIMDRALRYIYSSAPNHNEFFLLGIVRPRLLTLLSYDQTVNDLVRLLWCVQNAFPAVDAGKLFVQVNESSSA